MKDLKLTVTALRAMVSVAASQKIDSVSLPVSLLEDIANQMETLVCIIEEEELETDRFEDYLLEIKECAKVKATGVSGMKFQGRLISINYKPI
ncbi:hypothetical protein HNP21_006281 [Bacillus aryabhattai]|uniref:Uncharacterized protein n=1 Tax=Priestia aryabhattai TaxID=412384 RepID=A0A7W3NHG0_PRIAR|nr:hypothetical protein [Priestia aryabhattai]MBA9043103.1 hypothetical protein [Priestia aryabhattai]